MEYSSGPCFNNSLNEEYANILSTLKDVLLVANGIYPRDHSSILFYNSSFPLPDFSIKFDHNIE